LSKVAFESGKATAQPCQRAKVIADPPQDATTTPSGHDHGPDPIKDAAEMAHAKVVMRGRRTIAHDGKTMTITSKGVNAKGKTINNVEVFEKQ
jgi:hypothetical protein